jgi:hypothetical protein
VPLKFAVCLRYLKVRTVAALGRLIDCLQAVIPVHLETKIPSIFGRRRDPLEGVFAF